MDKMVKLFYIRSLKSANKKNVEQAKPNVYVVKQKPKG